LSVAETLVRLRPYHPDDFESSLEVWMAAWQAAMPQIAFAKRLDWWRHRWLLELVPNNTITVAELDGLVVGFVVINPETGWLDQVAVTPAHWSSGIATALVEEAKRLAPDGIRLDVNQTNERAIHLYERLGFRRTGEGVYRNSGAPTFLYEWTR
jgi:putative acetyltransferase